MRKKKLIWHIMPILLELGIIMLLSGCSDRVKNEAEIVKDIQEMEAFISHSAEISSCEINKRQTDKDNRSDKVFVTVHAENEDLICTLSYVLYYNLYNEGWMLEGMLRDYDGPWEFDGLSDEQLIDDIKEYDQYYLDTDSNYQISDIEIVNTQYNSSASNLYEKLYQVEFTSSFLRYDYCASYNITYQIVEGSWELQEISKYNSKFTPTHSPAIEASDDIMETLEIVVDDGLYVDGLYYDSFEYLRTDKDWENGMETRYYTATKDWFYGTETYLVEIPLTFSAETSEPHWSYNSRDITHTLQSVNWNIQGVWRCDYAQYSWPTSALNGYCIAELQIYNITATDDPNAYNVELYCDGYSTNYNYLCYIAEHTIVQMERDDGGWTIVIERPDDLAGDAYWCGRWHFSGFDYADIKEGLVWYSTRDGVELQKI